MTILLIATTFVFDLENDADDRDIFCDSDKSDEDKDGVMRGP